MTDAVAFRVIEKQNLVRLRNGLIASQVTHKNAAIWKYELRGSRRLFRAFVAATPLAVNIADGDGGSLEERLNGDFGHGLTSFADVSTENQDRARRMYHAVGAQY